VLAHSPKTSIGKDESDQNDVTGSAAWVDLPRAAFILRAMSLAEAKQYGFTNDVRGNYVSFSVVKSNYGPTGEKRWLMRSTVPGYGVSILIDVPLTRPQPVSASQNLDTKIVDFVGQHPRQYTLTKLREYESGKSGRFGVGKNTIAGAVHRLIEAGDLRLVEPTDEQRKKYGLRDPKTQVLEAV